MKKPSPSKASAAQTKKHHRVKKLMKLAVLAGAAYGAKKLWDAQNRSTKRRTP